MKYYYHDTIYYPIIKMIENIIRWISTKIKTKPKIVCVNTFSGSQDIKIQYCDSIKWIIVKNIKINLAK